MGKDLLVVGIGNHRHLSGVTPADRGEEAAKIIGQGDHRCRLAQSYTVDQVEEACGPGLLGTGGITRLQVVSLVDHRDTQAWSEETSPPGGADDLANVDRFNLVATWCEECSAHQRER